MDYNNIDTFGEDDVNNYFINKIKNTLLNYHNNLRVMQERLDKIMEEYNETIDVIVDETVGSVRYDSSEKTDIFNDLIEQAKKQIIANNERYRNNPPYYDVGGKRSRSKRSRSKRSRSKHTRLHI